MNSSLTKNILFDSFSGNTTSMQDTLIEKWLEDPANQELYFQYLDEWESLHPQIITNPQNAFEKINKTIEANKPEKQKPIITFQPKISLKKLGWFAAASLFIASVILLYSLPSGQNEISYNHLVQATKDKTGEMYEKTNLSGKPLLVTLPDESTIMLEPNSKISYSPKSYNSKRREVILSGEAFFEVKKNKEHPFYVFADELITKVLGTSFTIKSGANGEKSEVIVKTGRVEVFSQSDERILQKMEVNELEGLVLEPNQHLSFEKKENSFSAPTKVIPEKLHMPIQTMSFDFVDTPAIEVLEALKKAYNVEINYSRKDLAGCHLTARLSDEPLFEKLDLITFALQASYTKEEDSITITAKGCLNK